MRNIDKCPIHDDPTVAARLRIVEGNNNALLLEIDSLLVDRVYETLASEAGRRAVTCMLAKMGEGLNGGPSYCSIADEER